MASGDKCTKWLCVFGSLVRMSQNWEISVGTGCVYLSPNLGSLWEWAKDWVRSELEVLVAFYVNPGNSRSPACWWVHDASHRIINPC